MKPTGFVRRLRWTLLLLTLMLATSSLITFYRYERLEISRLSFASPHDHLSSLENTTGSSLTGKASPSDYQNKRREYRVNFLDRKELALADTFSASWLQSRADFMNMSLANLTIPEHASFSAFFGRMTKLRMTADLLDFSVDHLSKWWKMLGYQENSIVYDSITLKLKNYIKRGKAFVAPKEPVFDDTLAMVAFMPYTGRTHEERSFNLTLLSLAATIESLRRAEMGRIIVVGLDQSDREYVETAFKYLSNNLLPGNSANTTTTTSISEVQRIGQSEVAFVKGNKTLGSSISHPRNVPVSTVLGIREALSIAELSPSERTLQHETYMKVWLGNMEDVKHLYLTEPDSILQTRPSSLKYIKHEIDNGGMLAPHRLQPIPHQSDLFGGASTTANISFLKESDGFTNVLNLDAIENHDVCCDEQAGKLFKPGPRDFPKCGRKTRWWACGLESQATNQVGDGDDPHIRLRPYQLIRLQQGTQLVTIAGTLHGRRCFASKNSLCT